MFTRRSFFPEFSADRYRRYVLKIAPCKTHDPRFEAFIVFFMHASARKTPACCLVWGACFRCDNSLFPKPAFRCLKRNNFFEKWLGRWRHMGWFLYLAQIAFGMTIGWALAAASKPCPLPLRLRWGACMGGILCRTANLSP